MRRTPTTVRGVLTCLALLSSHASAAEPSPRPERLSLGVQQLRCEYRDAPLGVDHPAPRLSWVLTAPGRGQRQSAYRVLVARSPSALGPGSADLWDSGRVESDRSVNVRYSGAALESGQRCFWKVRVWDESGVGSEWSTPSTWEMGLLRPDDWKGCWIDDGRPVPEKDADFYRDDPAPLFRREFTLSGAVRSARLYVSALGYVHPRLNGAAVGDHHLDPIWTLPDKRVFYSVYDVGKRLRTGANCLAVTLGNGWYNPLPLRMWGRINLRERLPVGRPRFIAQLRIEYADGTRELVTSDATWKVAPGPILRNSIYLGEKVDARRAIAGWDEPGLDDEAWEHARVAPPPSGVLQARPLPPIRVTATVQPTEVTEPAPGVYVVDMGQNFAGWARFAFDVPEGTEITLRYGELLHEDGSLNPMTSVCGQIKRGKPGEDGSPAVAWQTDTYIARGGGPETYTPRFTFHAFRYVEVTGLPSAPSLDTIEGLRMSSAVEPVGSFSCSDDQLNRIQTMCQWTFLSNLFGVQSDCPHRERFGYGGDLVTTSDAFILNYDMAGLYAKAARDWHDSALPGGMLTDTAPSVGIQYCGVAWAMAHPHLLLQLHRYYGDRRIVEEQYPTARRWLELVREQNPDHIVRRGLHDHEALEKEAPGPMVTPLYCESARMLSRLARVLGKEAEASEYARLADAIRDAYLEEFLARETGVVASGIQSVQAFALFLDMLPAEIRPAAISRLLRDVTEGHGGHLTTGIFGTRFLLDVLSREGHADVVHRMVGLRDFPGWGHMLERGATTLWEHWAYSDNTYSHNHPMFGSVSQWLYNWLGGIEPTADAVAFDTFTIQPQLLERLDWVRCTHRSIRGPITCDWRRDGDRVVLDLQVPVSTAATLVLPGPGSLTEDGRPATEAPGVEKAPERAGSPAFRLESGRYRLVFQPEAPEPDRSETTVDWPAFLRQHDMIFDELPRRWQEAPHFGNAMVGSMLYRVGDALRLQVFRADVQDHRDDTHGWPAYSRPRLLIGHFSLSPVGKLTGCSWRKSLWDAELTGTITTDRGEIGIRHLVHSDDMAIVTELTPSAGERELRWTWHPAPARTTRAGYPTEESGIPAFAKRYGDHYAGTLEVWEPNPPGRRETGGEATVWVQDLLAGGQYATSWGERIDGDRRVHIASIASSYPGSTAAATALSDVRGYLKRDLASWLEAHRRWWHEYYPRSFLTIPDRSLESLYWQSIYRYGCTSRTGRCYVDTSGIWFQGGPWAYTTTNWNIQCAHWGVGTANRLDQGQELLDRFHDRRAELIRAVRPVEWQRDSAYLPHEVAGDMIGNREQDMRYYAEVGNLPWAMHNLWLQYRYSMDDGMLRQKVYPLLRRSIQLYLHMLEEGEDGTLRLPPTYSPETGVHEDCNFDLALLRWGCHTLLAAGQRLGIDDPMAPRWKEVLENLRDYPVDEHGFRLGSKTTSPANHRHFSHLLMIYPLYLVNIEQPGSREVLERSYRRATSVRGLPAMVESHVGPIGAALGRGDDVLEGLRRLQADLHPNGLWFRNPCIESTLSAANIIQDMLIQSWTDPAAEEPGPIRIFPALPSSWKDVEFHDLRAEGAFLVSARRTGGETEWVRIRSLAGEPCRVRPGWSGPLRVKGDRAHAVETVAPGVYEIDIEKGEEVLLREG